MWVTGGGAAGACASFGLESQINWVKPIVVLGGTEDGLGDDHEGLRAIINEVLVCLHCDGTWGKPVGICPFDLFKRGEEWPCDR